MESLEDQKRIYPLFSAEGFTYIPNTYVVSFQKQERKCP